MGLGGFISGYKKPLFLFLIRVALFLFMYSAPRLELHGLHAGTNPSPIVPPASDSTR